jgi:hypothetical protein
VQKKIDEIRESYPDVEIKQIDTVVDFTLGNYEAAVAAYDCGPARRNSRSARNTLLYRPSIQRRPFEVTFK